MDDGYLNEEVESDKSSYTHTHTQRERESVCVCVADKKNRLADKWLNR